MSTTMAIVIGAGGLAAIAVVAREMRRVATLDARRLARLPEPGADPVRRLAVPGARGGEPGQLAEAHRREAAEHEELAERHATLAERHATLAERHTALARELEGESRGRAGALSVARVGDGGA